MTEGKRRRVVLVGCGNISKAWLGPTAKRADLEFAGLVDLREAAARKRAEEYSLTSAAIGTDAAAMIREQKPDRVFDCTLPEAHVTVVTAALKAGRVPQTVCTDNIHSLAMVHAAIRSADTGKRVSVASLLGGR